MVDSLGFVPYQNTIFWGETIALIAFGIAWITAGKILVANDSERFKLTEILQSK